jgi:hypothetical protein
MEGSLEEDILNCLWEAGCPLVLLDIWGKLDKRGIKIPIKELEKILKAMQRLQILIQHNNQIDYPSYEPSFSLVYFYRNPIRAIQLCIEKK